MSVHRLHAVVHGRVQGVGYRYWAHHTAQRLTGIAGYIKNLPDGSVEVEAECPEKGPLDALFHELHVGPDAAQVTEVAARWEEIPAARFTGFKVS